MGVFYLPVIHRFALRGEPQFTYNYSIIIMSKEKLLQTLTSEIEQINEEIDLKVIRGIPYKREAKRHKLLVSMLNEVGEKMNVRQSFSFLSFLL